MYKNFLVFIIILMLYGCCDYSQTAIINNNSTEKININTSTEDELMSLSGIKEVKARSIIENRPYKSIYELPKKTKVGDKVFYNIKKELKI